MSSLPKHGCINCSRCFDSEQTKFDNSQRTGEGWRITANPLAWGSIEPEIIVLGFSKGPTQSGALLHDQHNQIAFKKGRGNIAKIFTYLDLIEAHEEPKTVIDRLISDQNGRFHFGSLIRCTVERLDPKTKQWKGSGGGMLDNFVKTDFGRQITSNCINKHLSDLPKSTKLIVMFGLGSKLNYVNESYQEFKNNLPGTWRKLNDISYMNENITVVHVEHFASQGALIPNWLGVNNNPRHQYGLLAKKTILQVISNNDKITQNE